VPLFVTITLLTGRFTEESILSSKIGRKCKTGFYLRETRGAKECSCANSWNRLF